jgi:16S rRNA (cytosine1402-N4)-methyltransferase
VAEPTHVPVLLAETVGALAPARGETYLDCTAGLGGHAEAVGGAMGEGTIVLNDADPGNLARAQERVLGSTGGRGSAAQAPSGTGQAQAASGTRPGVIALRGNFADAPRRLQEMGLAADMVLADLGFASGQMEDPARGLSFMRDGPLDMRFDPEGAITAAELVGSLPEAELARIIAEYGEERGARRVARKLVEARRAGPIETTGQLAGLVRAALGRRQGGGGIDPATKTFQALRIAVNDELGNLGALLAAVERGSADVSAGEGGRASWLREGARVAVISFHSLEDRAVKRAFAGLVEKGLAERVTRKAVTAGEDEVGRNPRARSAKLRVVRLVGRGSVGARPAGSGPGLI